MKSSNAVLALTAVTSLMTGCSSTSSGGDSSPQSISVQSNAAQSYVQLNDQQIRDRVVGNTLVGRSNNFPQVGPIDFQVHYAADGKAKDRLRFTRSGRIDRATGTWRTANTEEGIFCSTFAKRRQGAEVCTRIFVSTDQFRTEPTNPSISGNVGRIIAGDLVN